MNDVRTCPQCGRTYGGDDRFCTVDGAALVASGSGSLLGTVVADRFLVQEKLGEGGMGEVYLAEHVRMKRKVALKLMRPWMLGDPVAVGRFHREAENASQISHPNVAQVYDFGETTDRIVYLAMEYVDGEPLSRILGRDGRLHTVRTAEIVRQTGEALTAAHAMGILHRDLKPDNVMIGKGRNGTDLVKLVDFGIARAMHRGTQQFTSTGLVVGTPDYMSPEQLAGDDLDGRSDLYALALMAFRMLTGASAYPEGSSSEAMVARLTSQPRPLLTVRPEVAWPDALQAAFNRALAPDPNARYADALEFVAEIDAAVSAMPLSDAEQAYLVALSQRSATPARSPSIASPSIATPALSTPSLPTPPARPASGVQRVEPLAAQASALLTPPSMPRQTQPRPAVARAPDSVLDPVATTPEAVSPDDAAPSGTVPTTVEPEPAASPQQEPAALPQRESPETKPSTAGGRQRPRAITWGVAGVAAAALIGWLVTRDAGEATPPASVAPVAPTAAVQVDSVAVVGPPVGSDSAAAPDAAADSLLLLTARRATLAAWSSAGRGAAVLVDSSGLALTSADLVPPDSVVGVFIDANTQLKATVLSVDRTSGLATLLLPMRRCQRCAIVAPVAEDPAVADSVFFLPASNRAEGSPVATVVSAFDARSIATASAPRGARGAPVISRAQGRLVALGTATRRLVTPTAIRDAVVKGRVLARTTAASEESIPVWPEASVPRAQLNDVAERVRPTIESYRQTANDVTLLVMTPQVMRYRADEAADPMKIPADPIRGWQPFDAYVSERRAVVMLNASNKDAAFPFSSRGDVDFRRGDVTMIRLFRNDTLVAPIESGTYSALTANGSRPIARSFIAAYAPSEFAAGTLRVEITDARQNRPISMTLLPGTLDQVHNDFAWLSRR
ncbi:MAG: protein kinase [Gemmatimonadaceae bacterium]|nr:protein kinase [Gemmatimonadaceae bacterium]